MNLNVCPYCRKENCICNYPADPREWQELKHEWLEHYEWRDEKDFETFKRTVEGGLIGFPKGSYRALFIIRNALERIKKLTKGGKYGKSFSCGF